MSPAKKGKATKTKNPEEASNVAVTSTEVSDVVEKSKRGGKAGIKEVTKSAEEVTTKNGSVDGEKKEHVEKDKSIEDKEESATSNAEESKDAVVESADGSKVVDDKATKAGKKGPAKKAAAKKASENKKESIEEKMDVDNDVVEGEKVVANNVEDKTEREEESKDAEKVEEPEKADNDKKAGKKAPAKKGGKKDQENKKETEEVMDVVDRDAEISNNNNNVEGTQKAEEEQAAKTIEKADAKVTKKSAAAASKKAADSKKEDVSEKMDVDDEEEKKEKVEETKPTRGGKRGANAAVKDNNAPEAEKSTRSSRRNASEKVAESSEKVVEKTKVVAKKAANVKETKKNEVKAAASAKSEEKKTGKKEGVVAKEDSGSNKDVGRKRKTAAAREVEVSQAKKPKLAYDAPSVPALSTVTGSTLAWGDGEMGQLGLGPDVYDTFMPKAIDLGVDSKKVVQVFAGGLHSLVLTSDGEIYSFGCNDESPLGRDTEEEENCFTPQKVVGIEGKVVQIACGDNHSIALDEHGGVYIWGTFRDNEGLIGMTPEEEAGHKEAKKSKKNDDEDKPMGKYNKIDKPLRILRDVKVVKIATGFAHILCLSDQGQVYSLGVSETGQLGRSSEYFSRRGGRRGVDDWLTAKPVRFRKRTLKFIDIWAGGRASFAKSVDGEVYAWGLNNYVQLGFPDMENRLLPEVVSAFDPTLDWKIISCNGNHTLALDAAGKVYVLGCKDNGRLGMGDENLEEAKELTPIKSLEGKKFVCVSAGPAVSFAVEDDGSLYCWGAGSCKQLAQGEDAEDDIYVPTLIAGKLKNMKVMSVSAGGTHVLALAGSKN